MNSRDRLLLALNHKEADRVPVDLGGTSTSAISLTALRNLNAHLGFRSEVRAMPPLSMTAYPGEDLIKRFSLDVRSIAGKPPAGFKPEAMSGGKVRDEWGIVYRKHEIAETHFIVESEAPLRCAVSKDEIDHYPWPDPSDPSRVEGLREAVQSYRTNGFGVAVNTSLMVMTQTQWLRGLEQFMIDTALNTKLLEYMMDKVLEIMFEMAHRLLEQVGDSADVVIMGDDLSHQGGLTYSPEMYRRIFKPRHRQIIDFLKAHARNAKILYHCCGGIEPLIRDLMEIGVDAVNPVQVSAKRMEDTRKLKSLYGRDLTFWGGIDTQRVLPFGTPQQVRAEVKRRIEDLAPGGGYVLAAVHNIRPEVPPENVCALFDAATEFGQYPIRLG
jgi:uroporphyrinogen decarboxylase